MLKKPLKSQKLTLLCKKSCLRSLELRIAFGRNLLRKLTNDYYLFLVKANIQYLLNVEHVFLFRSFLVRKKLIKLEVFSQK